jgi:CheY-like chemotaxis protein
MHRQGPLIIIEDDLEDHQIVKEALSDMKFSNPVKFFTNGEDALDFLRMTTENPFLILCDINMPKINGLQLRSVIELSPTLKKKSTPFVFFSTTARDKDVALAYDLTVQGYFEKAYDFQNLKRQLKLIFEYWAECRHPNSLQH